MLKLDTLVSNLSAYIETRIELVKLELKEDVAKVGAKASVYGVLLIIVLFAQLFLSMAIAYRIGDEIGNFGGFSIVAGVYLVITAVIWGVRDKMSNKVEKELNELLNKKKK